MQHAYILQEDSRMSEPRLCRLSSTVSISNMSESAGPQAHTRQAEVRTGMTGKFSEPCYESLWRGYLSEKQFRPVNTNTT